MVNRPYRGLDPDDPQSSPADRQVVELDELQGDLQRRQYHPRVPQKMSHVVNKLARQRGYFQDMTDERWSEAWVRVLNGRADTKRLVDATRVGKLRRGSLEIHVANSTVLQELTFNKTMLLKKIRTEMPEAKIRDLKFRIGAIS